MLLCVLGSICWTSTAEYHRLLNTLYARGWAALCAAKGLEQAGAILLVTNTMHKVAPQLDAALNIPLLRIVNAAAQVLQAAGLTRVGLHATAFTVEQGLLGRTKITLLVGPEDAAVAVFDSTALHAQKVA